MLIRKTIRIPEELDQFIQNKADKQALLDGKCPNWTKALINHAFSQWIQKALQDKHKEDRLNKRD